MCGGTRREESGAMIRAGLSPRVRGNHADRWQRQLPAGSIPACAGEPCCSRQNPLVRRVYPRVCGGTLGPELDLIRRQGLSPRVRGNLQAQAEAVERLGSIPACAGEPLGAGHRGAARRVYPRVCGGTKPKGRPFPSSLGLSPRVRGNHGVQDANPRRPGSIPACAGEPPPRGLRRHRRGVYPRVCGGTVRVRIVLSPVAGLSPRVRGNPRPTRALCRPSGSIPACAGEPVALVFWVGPRRVYPRVCGGTSGPAARMRGSSGSIPACAGEPADRPPP